ncbi:hypothetical protein [Halalkalicoccus tibetensis]|uniref:Uncharacterized protein n=1 Tax=Halalkalicoccus tibetensis TaxID=175632 RepID=A0ABD5V0Y2_9EURY
MSAVPCPNCVAEGVDFPLLIDGECLHCTRPDAPVTRRVEDATFRARSASDSLRWRLRTARVRAVRQARALTSLVAGLGR